ncbi:MAG: FAD-dependent oxidoreductase [Oscillospiraceae bacterium]|nr:FAD-dependent oxidoreductase [Oscillospiraceae bacterium]
MDSIWVQDMPRVQFDTAKENINTDVLIIGGGIAGILCKYKLKNAGIDCTLVEATEICSGITKNTTAKITLGHGSRFTEHGELIDNPATDDRRWYK